jgi:hypothetical protein
MESSRGASSWYGETHSGSSELPLRCLSQSAVSRVPFITRFLTKASFAPYIGIAMTLIAFQLSDYVSYDTVQRLALMWAWCFFALNTIMTGSIVFRIQYDTITTLHPSTLTDSAMRRRLSDGFKKGHEGLRWHPSTFARAVIESSFVAWVGVLSCGISWCRVSGGVGVSATRRIKKEKCCILTIT